MNAISTETQDDSPMRSWLKALNAAVRNPQTEKELFGLRLPAIDLACRGFGAAAWNRETLRTAIERCQFWPSAGEIHAILGEWARDQKPAAERMGGELTAGRAVERIAGPKSAGRTPEDIAAVEAKRAAIVAELRDMANARRANDGRPQPRHMTPRQLVERYAQTESGRATIAMRPDLAAVWAQMRAEQASEANPVEDYPERGKAAVRETRHEETGAEC